MGKFLCDSPKKLIDYILEIAWNVSNPSLILYLGDSAGHGISTWYKVNETYEELLKLTLSTTIYKMEKSFPNVPILPTLGNNDVLHNGVASPTLYEFYSDMYNLPNYHFR